MIIRRYYYEQKPAEIAIALELSKKQVENKVGYALTILKNGYNEPTKLGGRQNGSAWNNKDLDTAYAQMNFEDLEKQLLSN